VVFPAPLGPSRPKTEASFTEMRQHIEGVLRGLGHECSFVEMDDGCTKDTFITGRSAFILVGKEAIGFLGEIHPAVLEKFGLLIPVVAAEFNIESLKNCEGIGKFKVTSL
ncbi:MAG: phenylalanyl-tRNA synthetase, beta subunit, partial [Parcubacteria group bacterium Greene0416_79]